jgi:hypothetical protein
LLPKSNGLEAHSSEKKASSTFIGGAPSAGMAEHRRGQLITVYQNHFEEMSFGKCKSGAR